ncbi:hypothetical protein CANTEDRAFT_135637 [Yamadazyma tenuis ATCC 10573]|uniref:GYF domain-containing protein n=1 Tax=Candida tenuis (strain ATCC 10573 / BCRC 21748 / CBS 615 / JCM 9827 / NBRC 10315 / NRRL Y-1498 / VKM Y-70) TaxID=590646 RepID=G3B803_CANTC|nr:uncharacterized protein CANTEDRAFT_135637 [Yamadazyma tenuis ATCC 10573]EGV61698.1 hypothetical protein CANTEDRAFT_135637 [Yamadazyma tenuis ATCC 10573]
MSEEELEETVLGGSRRRRDKLKKSIRDEYSSDSSDSDQEPSKSPPTQDQQDSDSDMFASENDEKDSENPPTKKPKSPKKMDMSKFELEVGIDGIHEEEGSEADIEIEAFDLRQEEEEGYFDDDGNFVRHQELEDAQDIDDWVNADKEQIRKAKQAQEKHLATKTLTSITQTTAELLENLIGVLEPDETPMEALVRLAPAKRRRGKKNHNETNEDKHKKQLILKNQRSYEKAREELMRLYRRETGEDFKFNRGIKRPIDEVEQEDDFGDKIWEFKWDDSDEINGPYSEYEMGFWKNTYFENKVVVRRVGDMDFVHVSEVDFSV